MNTPILDFLREFERRAPRRFHMPGHKGRGPLGCEAWDITEIDGADSLYEASGIIAESEEHAARLFGSRRTVFSTEGSSQCVRAMLYLALVNRPDACAPVVLAVRNVHRSFVYAAGLLDLQVEWLWPEESASLCSCPVPADALEQVLASLPSPPAAVYVTSPDYLGGIQDIRGLAETAHRHGTLLLVDNAHGAYLHFLGSPRHPLDLGADLCCDSAHKTLGVLTGGAWLHVGKTAPPALADRAKQAMALFGSTSPSYLILASLDACNAALAGEEPKRIQTASEQLAALRGALDAKGWELLGDEPLKLTIAAPEGWTGKGLQGLLRAGGVEAEYADQDFVTLMASGETSREDFQAVAGALRSVVPRRKARSPLPLAKGERILSIRQALLAPCERIAAEDSEGFLCASPSVSCPPAIPVAVSGERIGPAAVRLFRHYGMEWVDVVRRRGPLPVIDTTRFPANKL